MAAEKFKGIYKDGRLCSVPNCLSKEGGGVYSFHRIVRKDKTQSSKWIEQIGRLNSDGTEWQPKRDLICGKHFVGGKPSSDVLDPDYIPTLHMPNSRKRSYTVMDKERHKRVRILDF